MPETKQIAFSHREVAEALIRFNDLHEGLWGIYIEFGLGAADVGLEPGGDIFPTALVPVKKIGLQRFEEPSNLTVDAAEVNPIKENKKK